MIKGRIPFVYMGTALLLGGVWYLALLIPELTRSAIVDHALGNAALISVVSVVVAVIFYRPIAAARKPWQTTFLALVLPFAGATVWLWPASVLGWLGGSGESEESVWKATVVWFFMLPSVLAVLAVTTFYVLVPMGLLSQYIMHAVARAGSGQTNGNNAT